MEFLLTSTKSPFRAIDTIHFENIPDITDNLAVCVHVYSQLVMPYVCKEWGSLNDS